MRRAAAYAAGLVMLVLAGAGASHAQDAGLARKLTLKEAVSLAVANSLAAVKAGVGGEVVAEVW